jgi:hypothetical protein
MATMYVGVLPQEFPIPQRNEGFQLKVKKLLMDSLTQHYVESNVEVLYGPKSETDDRFYIRLHDTIKSEDEKLDQVHLYRAAGLDMLMVTTVVKSDKRDVVRPYHTVGEDTCLSMVLGYADKKK